MNAEATTPSDGSPGTPDVEPAEVSTSASAFGAPDPGDYQLEDDNPSRVQSTAFTQRPSRGLNADLSPQITKSSRSIRLEPPPVVLRPPRVKSDGFSSAAWFAWVRNEEKDILDCARSMKHSYSYRSTFRLFGLSLSRDVTFKTTVSGIDAAVVNFRFGWGKSEANWALDHLPRVRKRLAAYTTEPNAVDEERQDDGSQEQSSTTAVEGEKRPKKHVHGPPRAAHPWLNDYYYVVVGIGAQDSAPKEVLRRVMRIDGLFQQIRTAHRHLRNPIRRAVSLKEVAGFGIYQCDPSKGYHKEVELDNETRGTLAELWRSYNTHKLDYEGRWLMWIHQHFNNSSKNAEEGTLTLELKLRWSIFKVVSWGVVPILLSLAIGFYYMYKDHGEVDEVAVAEAAWVIATYIITTSALIFALLAVITQLGDV
ncbi:hypothetical protein H2200_007940 [Cladophialophora chaetospira]|uniref:Uncharacterized protein n=1 Tax=Cladophialophora chaetospira TaxID=386627 RepID=A0AA38X756_9EURO|nr:hypothetical protein H2200_007940 [Cladophialophora chaetospira]